MFSAIKVAFPNDVIMSNDIDLVTTKPWIIYITIHPTPLGAVS